MIHQGKLKISSINALGLICSLFLTCFYMRIEFMGSLANINYLFYLSFLLLVFTEEKIRTNGKEIFLLIVMIIQVVIINEVNGVSFKQLI